MCHKDLRAAMSHDSREDIHILASSRCSTVAGSLHLAAWLESCGGIHSHSSVRFTQRRMSEVCSLKDSSKIRNEPLLLTDSKTAAGAVYLQCFWDTRLYPMCAPFKLLFRCGSWFAQLELLAVATVI